jgi:glycosyltransferase involved in cell wall biosynthesis
LKGIGVECDYYKIIGKGINGYLKNMKPLRAQIRKNDYDLVHSHFGLSGLLASLQRELPTVVTFHGSDVNKGKNRLFSLIASKLSHYNIIVDKNMAKKLLLRDRFSSIPCGVDLKVFHPLPKESAKKQLGLQRNKRYILFSSSFDNAVKNYPLAKEAVALTNPSVQLLELKNKNREEVNLCLNACDLLLMTSHTEGSPQVVKEALACNTPVVSTDVGDVKDLISDLNCCFLTPYEAADIADKIETVLSYDGNRSNSRNRMKDFELQKVAKRIKAVYDSVLA